MLIRSVSLLVFILISSGVHGEPLRFETLDGADVVIRFERPLENIVPKVVDAYPRARAALENKLRMELSLKPVIYLVHTDAEFHRMTGGNRLVTAFAVSGANTIYLNYSKMFDTPFDLELTLTHELSHLLLHEYIQPNHLPKWLNEGVSQWVSGGVAEIIKYDAKKLLKQAVLSGNYLTLEDMHAGFPGGTDRFILAYEESKSIVGYIDETYGSDRILQVLERLHQGETLDTAISASLGVDLYSLEQDWHAHLRRKYTWYIYLSDNFFWILFSAAALLTLIGFVRLRIRMKTHFADEEDEHDEY